MSREAAGPTPRALVVEDDRLTLRYLAELVEQENFQVTTATTLEEARRALSSEMPDVLLVDLSLPDGQGVDLFQDLESRTATEVVVITGNGSVDSVVETLQLGACDYLTKPIDASRLRAILHNVLRIGGLSRKVDRLHEQLRQLGKFGSLVGVSPQMESIYDLVEKVAPTDATVFVTGESGTGKEVVARTIHEFSSRSSSPFVAINCGAISTNLIESELFGHEKGSFTGATSLHRGSFEQADGGTLLLDEIAEMPLELQVKLLRALETSTFLRVGGSHEISVDVRVVAATNRAPLEAIADGRLREDLYYRLNVFSLEMPPLRERTGDVDLLATRFLSELNRDEGSSKRVSDEALEILRRHSWPGNVRELRNVMQRSFIVATDAILPEHLPPELRAEETCSTRLAFEVGTPLAEVEKHMLLATLEHQGGNKRKTAEILGMNVRTLYNRLAEYEKSAGDGERDVS